MAFLFLSQLPALPVSLPFPSPLLLYAPRTHTHTHTKRRTWRRPRDAQRYGNIDVAGFAGAFGGGVLLSDGHLLAALVPPRLLPFMRHK